jgi:S-adenosyl methyltransferase
VPATDDSWITDEIDQFKPSAARLYDYLLGGAHNFAADRALGEKILAKHPDAAAAARLNRAFMRRAVLFMVDQGIRQFLDLGSGIPTVGNVHEIAQHADERCRVVYVDYEDVAVAHGSLLLAGNDRAAMLAADATEPSAVLDAPETKRLIDFSEPVGLLAITLFHYVAPQRDPYGVMRRYRDVLATGSYLGLSHLGNDVATWDLGWILDQTKKDSMDGVYPRSHAEVLDLFTGFELVKPGLVITSRWRPDRRDDAGENEKYDVIYAGVGRKI